MRRPAPPCILSSLSAHAIPNGQNRYGAQAGSALGEYGLIGAGMLVLTIGALFLLGGNVNGIMRQFQSQTKNQAQVANSANVQHQADMSSFTPTESSHILTGAATNVYNTGSVTQTAGVNGSTETSTKKIEAAAKQNLDSGTIDQAQYDLVMKVSNKGHEIAAIQGLLEKAYKDSNGDTSVITAMQITFNDNTYTPAQLLDLLGADIREFNNLNSQALSKGTLSKELSAVLQSSAQEISDSGNSTYVNCTSLAGFMEYMSTITAETGSANTNQQAATICTAGQHLDVNNQCVDANEDE